MDHDGSEEHSLRRQETLDIVDNDIGNHRRQSQRAHAVASMRKITKTLSKKSTSQLLTHNGASGSIQKRRSVTLSKTKPSTSALSRKKSSTAKNGPTPQPSSSGSLLNKSSKSGSMSTKSTTDKNGVELCYQRGSFVVTKAPWQGDGQRFYICRVLQNIYNFTKSAKVRWLDKATPKPQQQFPYKMKYLDRIDPACILLEVKMDQTSRLFYELPQEQRDEIMNILDIVEDFEKGKIAIGDVDDDAKKSAQEKGKAERKPRKKKEQKEPMRKTASKVDDLELTPRPEVKVLTKDPLFETNTPMPHISMMANSRLIFRAIYMEDIEMLRKLLEGRNYCVIHLYNKSVDHQVSPLAAAIQTKNVPIFKLLLHESFGSKFSDRKKDNYAYNVSRYKLDTGNYKSLGISCIRKIQASQGTREGNNAFLGHEPRTSDNHDVDHVFHEYLVPYGIPDDFKEAVCEFYKDDVEDVYESIGTGGGFNRLIGLLLTGNYKAAGKLLNGPHVSYPLREASNQLIKEILSLETEELSGCPPSAVKFTCKATENLTTFHYAAVNPNPKYLEKLQSVEPLANISDSKGRRPIHFAACCSRPDNLELLLNWGANFDDTCQSRLVPLHYAINARKPQNVKFLLQKASENTSASPSKFGVGEVNRPFPDGKSPLQKAVDLEETEMIKLLLSHGALVNGNSSVSSMQVTSLMTAAGSGNLDIVKLLVDHGAVVEQKDRLGRTALVHACKNGATKVLSYLVHIGANPERPDSSENYPIHYAAAYGWFFTLRFLIDVGVDINVQNMWKFSPVSVAFVKGHVGIVSELLMNKNVDINFKMEAGTSVMFNGCEMDFCQKVVFEQIESLVTEKRANCDIKDVNGETALFYLANLKIIEDKEKELDAERQSEKIAQTFD